MKDSIKILFFVSLISFLFCSCSDDKDDNNKFLRKLVEIAENGTSNATLYKYNDNQIISSDNPKKHVDYTYKNGLIEKIVTIDKESQLSVTLEYTYADEKLLSITSSDDYVINYTHNSDGTVSYEKLTIDYQNQETRVSHGILYFDNENLIKDERVLDDTDEDVVSNYRINFEYDSHNNPFHNILGYDKLLDHNEAISLNNCVMKIIEITVTKGEEVTSSANLFEGIFKYDIDNYPTEQLSEASIGNPNYLKTQYFY